ncbi:MAG: hypothetical protein Kow0079_14060 [Vicingaceae bacterium]
MHKINALSKFILAIVLFITIAMNGFSQNQASVEDSTKFEAPKLTTYSPTIGLGIGMFKFYGDIMDAKYGNALISRIGYDLHVKQQINPFFTVKFYVLFGKLGANERTVDRNLNFESKITTGGFALVYNFDQILPKDRVVNPFLSLGIESVEFHSKTDLYDQYGNKYNYWSDGTIRNLPENDPNASSAIIIQRDYTYETDLREQNYDGFGKYPERTFAIPVGGGAKFLLTDNWEFTIGTTLHFTFTDLIDNVSADSEGERLGEHKGNGRNDRFLMSSIALSYNFGKEQKDEINDFDLSEDFLAMEDEDSDGDGVYDFVDRCAWTPPGVPVDEFGCPLDDDKDLVPNYRDDELMTRAGVEVTPTGVELTDTMIHLDYLMYMDSTGMFAKTAHKTYAHEKSKKKLYKVQVGSFTTAIDPELADKLMSYQDVEVHTFGDTTVFTVGSYNNLPDAIKRKMQVTAEGIEAAVVVEQGDNGNLTVLGDKANNMAVSGEIPEGVSNDEVFFRIQLGAYSRRIPKSEFGSIKNIVEIQTNDGLWKYLYGVPYKTVEDAAKKKVEMILDYGIKDAFIVAYKGGKRITLKEAGVNTNLGNKQEENKIQNKNNTTSNKDKISFKVQLGVYKNQVPTEVMNKFMEIGEVEQTTLDNGLTRYTSGNFKSLEEANKHLVDLINKGMGGAFVIAFDGDKLISIQEAEEMLQDN